MFGGDLAAAPPMATLSSHMGRETKRLNRVVQQTLVYELCDRLVPGGGRCEGVLGCNAGGNQAPVLARQL